MSKFIFTKLQYVVEFFHIFLGKCVGVSNSVEMTGSLFNALFTDYKPQFIPTCNRGENVTLFIDAALRQIMTLVSTVIDTVLGPNVDLVNTFIDTAFKLNQDLLSTVIDISTL